MDFNRLVCNDPGMSSGTFSPGVLFGLSWDSVAALIVFHSDSPACFSLVNLSEFACCCCSLIRLFSSTATKLCASSKEKTRTGLENAAKEKTKQGN